jgi:hypothetical protein
MPLTSPALVRPRRSGGGGWLMAVLIVPLISYSIMATIALALAYLNKPPDPLERLPDPGITPATKVQKHALHFGDTPLRALPPNLHVPLGHTITVGQVQVTPKKVELAKIKFRTPGQTEGDPSRFPTLILHLEFKNVSDDALFRPLDRYFDRKVGQEKFRVDMPFTYLVMGKSKIFGGALDYPGEKTFRLEGQDYDRDLKPGESMETFVCLDPDTQDPEGHLKKYPEDDVARYKGPLLYRVHVRRGLVFFQGRDVSTTAVIGVEFTDMDIQRSG